MGRTAWPTVRISAVGTIGSTQSAVGSEDEHPRPRVGPPLLEGGLGERHPLCASFDFVRVSCSCPEN